jgi:hypothetical protein
LHLLFHHLVLVVELALLELIHPLKLLLLVGKAVLVLGAGAVDDLAQLLLEAELFYGELLDGLGCVFRMLFLGLALLEKGLLDYGELVF